MNAEKFIEFLKALLDSVPGKIFLIVDGHPVHKVKKVSEFVNEKAGGRLSIFFLPPYSPHLNSDEWVWKNVKNDRIGRSVIMSANDLKTRQSAHSAASRNCRISQGSCWIRSSLTSWNYTGKRHKVYKLIFPS